MSNLVLFPVDKHIFFFLRYTFVVFAHPSLADPTAATVKTVPVWTNLMNKIKIHVFYATVYGLANVCTQQTRAEHVCRLCTFYICVCGDYNYIVSVMHSGVAIMRQRGAAPWDSRARGESTWVPWITFRLKGGIADKL